MTFAWYGHLKYRDTPLALAILVSWGIAFFEYCFLVPANRFGSYQFSTTQLKTIQEIITLVVFCFFSYFYFDEGVKTNQIIGFIFIVLAAYFIFKA
ncbi:Conserved putative membrane protein [Criblamydia sequanensis CRIB-18]|uniref:Conserved putative membrane protein n=2 Tax=Candidatus Criblamydia sequanensis TaxID=340071 RepID=A0A090D089_9BACT|nr:Conserved putative membrane protein [Criblamydia sequanensis CRIB-18]